MLDRNDSPIVVEATGCLISRTKKGPSVSRLSSAKGGVIYRFGNYAYA